MISQRADWLFTLAEYHQMFNNHAEQGQCLMRIYQGFKCCLPIWDRLGKPRSVRGGAGARAAAGATRSLVAGTT